MGAYEGSMNTEFVGGRSPYRNFTGRKSAERGRIRIDIDEKWFVAFERTINHLLVMFIYANLKTIFLFWLFFRTFFSFSFRAIYF